MKFKHVALSFAVSGLLTCSVWPLTCTSANGTTQPSSTTTLPATTALTSANSFYLGVNLGQAEVFAQRGRQYAYTGTTIDRARAHAGAIDELPSLATEFDSLHQQWVTSSALGNGVPNPALEHAVVVLLTRIEKSATGLAHQLLAGRRLGNGEAILAMGGEEAAWVNSAAIPWFKSVAMLEVKNHVRNAGVWTRGPRVIDWLISRQDAKDWSQDVEAARRVLYEELIGRPSLLRARAAHVELPIGTGQQVRDPVYARALVIDDGRKRVAVVSVDTTLIYGENYGDDRNDYDRVLNVLRPLTGLDELLIVATHSHHPTTASNSDVQAAIAAAILCASGGLLDAELAVGSGVAFEGFSRVIRDGNGHGTTDFPGRTIRPDILKYLSSHPLDAVDPQVGIIYVRAAGGGPAIATLVNYATHAVALVNPNDKLPNAGPSSSVDNRVSADYPGVLEAAVVNGLAATGAGSGGECLFLQGAAGDIDPWDCLLGDPGAARRMDEMATAISTTVLARIAAMHGFATRLPISVQRTTIDLPNFVEIGPYHFKAKQATVMTLLLGPQIAIGAFPGEFFSALGIQFKRRSACPFSLFVGYTNDAISYVPSEADWHIGAYGTQPRDESGDQWCGIAKGDGERIVAAALDVVARQRSTILTQH
jgi:hypothetical protein